MSFEVYNDYDVFNAEHLVVVTSNYDIRASEWSDYMEQNWERLIRAKSRCPTGLLGLRT